MAFPSIVEDQNRWWSDRHFRTSRAIRHVRPIFSKLWAHLGDRTTERAAVLIGPRQVGKTTLLLQLADRLLDEGWPPANLTYFDFSDDRLGDPVSPRVVVDLQMPGLRADWPRVFLLDEVQESVKWQRWLKGAIDSARRMDARLRPVFLLTGSAAGQLRNGGIESGPGRWDEINIEGLTYSEFLMLGANDGETVQDVASREPGAFRRYLLFGGFPEHARLGGQQQNPLARIRQDIVDRAILRDLRREGVDLDRVKRLFLYLITDSGSIWNAEARANDLGANSKSVVDWLTLLEQTHLVRRLEREVSSGAKASTKIKSRPKIYAADHGLITALSGGADPLSDSEIRGRVLEAVVYRHLREHDDAGNVTFFRPAEDLEIDFLLPGPRRSSVAIEVTSATDVDSRKLLRFTKAAGVAGSRKRLLIHGGIGRHSEGAVELVGAKDFLLAPDQWLGDSK